MINGRIVFYIEFKNLLSSVQWGFRKNKSIFPLFSAPKSVMRLRQKNQLPLHHRMLGNVREFMTNRTLIVVIGAHLSDPVTIENGVSQGA
jgi:hypothetical protein